MKKEKIEMAEEALFFDHWLIATGPNTFVLNGKYGEFLKAHAKNFTAKVPLSHQDWEKMQYYVNGY